MQQVTNQTWRHIGVVASVVLFGVALVTLYHILADVRLSDVVIRLTGTPVKSIFLTVACTVGSYFLLTGYDVLALRQIGKPMPYRKAALASFTSYTFSHNIGLSLLTGGSIRYRIYSAAGLSTAEIAMLTGICSIIFGLGVSVLLGLAMIFEPLTIGAIDRLPADANSIVGVILLVGVFSFVLWTGWRRQPLIIRGWSLPIPRLPMTLSQAVLGTAEICLAAAALYFVLPVDVNITFPAFAGVFVAAMMVGVVSHSPGGVGVFEAVVLLALPDADHGGLLGSLLLYRLIYYFLPLLAAAAMLSWHEFHLRRETLEPALQAVRDIAHAVVPAVLGTLVFIGGAILMLSAATPAIGERMTALYQFLPLPFIEVSHLLSSVLGLWLMLLARGLFRRLDDAFLLTVGVLCAGILFSILKGIDYEEALALGLTLLMLVSTRRAFYRKAALRKILLSDAWIATVAIVILGSIWLGLFAFKHVEYSTGLWWQFAYHGDAQRFLRASITVSGVAVGLLLLAVLRPTRPPAVGLNAALQQSVRQIVVSSPRTEANLALAGDKRFCVSESGDAFIMYQVQGRSWIAMSEPFGQTASAPELLWQFRELCDQFGGTPVFYQVNTDSIPLFLDLGLSILKIGEEARVDLAEFSLQGHASKELRYIDRRVSKEGAIFDIIPAAEVAHLMPELRAISDEWLREKSTQEKRFSVGGFSDEYMENFDCAVVREHGRIVAFANIWQAPAGGEMSVDLMRYVKDAPYGIMDFLFIRLMIWGKENKFSWFNLGMAPLSGLETHPLGPTWARAGAFIFRNGEHFYNFEGLRAYKEKFHPIWVPKYIASRGGMALPRILLDIATLISGGTREIFPK